MTEERKSWSDVFSSFVDRKTRAAMKAVMPPYITAKAAPRPELIPVGNAWTASRFEGPFYVATAAGSERPACSLVFVQSADGNTVAEDPLSLGGGETDKHVVYEGLSRVMADAVMVGAATIQGGGTIFSVWHPELVTLRRSLPLPRHPTQIVATLRGVDIERGLLFNVPDVSVVILTVSAGAASMKKSAAARPWIRLLIMQHRRDLRRAFQELRALGISRLSCVGGRTLAGQLLDLNLVDDVYLTTSTRPGGKPGTPMYSRALEGDIVVRKHGTGEEAGVVFEHIHLR